MKRAIYIILCLCFAMMGCREMRVSSNPTLGLSLSKDTISFDTVFAQVGSSTQRFMIRNRNKEALRIETISFQDGRYFHANVDGENDLTYLNNANLEIRGGDSIYVFVRVSVNPSDENSPFLIEDKLCFLLSNGKRQEVVLEAYGQNINLIKSSKKRTDYSDRIFNADKPYLIYDTIVVGGKLTIEAGAQLYFHNGASLWALGDVEAIGTPDKPIVFRGDRMDHLFDSVPYRYAAGLWDGIYLMHYQESKQVSYIFDNVDISSANVGVYCQSEHTDELPSLSMTNSRIHNQVLYGLVLQHIDAEIANVEVSNCGAYCVYLSGGKHRFVHTTIASYFNATNINIQSASRQDVAAVYIDNLGKQCPTIASFYNSIITGVRNNQLVLATSMDRYYEGIFESNYLKTDTLSIPYAEHNVYWQKEDSIPVFRNTYYKYKEYRYYDFRLDSLSPAIGIADSLTAISYPEDKVGTRRIGSNGVDYIRPDAGCYQHTDYN